MRRHALALAVVFSLSMTAQLVAQGPTPRLLGPFPDHNPPPVPFANGLLYGSSAEPWFTDGTAAGTRQLVDAYPGPPGGLRHFAVVGGRALFLAWSASSQMELWSTDGTPAGTTRVRALGSHTTNMPLVGNGAFAVFTASDAASGVEPWITDGTAAGTRLLVDVNPGPAGSDGPLGNYFFQGFGGAALGPHVWFAANDGVTTAIWRTDGTSVGTAPVTTLPGGSGLDIRGAHGGAVIAFETLSRLLVRILPSGQRQVLGDGLFPFIHGTGAGLYFGDRWLRFFDGGQVHTIGSSLTVLATWERGVVVAGSVAGGAGAPVRLYVVDGTTVTEVAGQPAGAGYEGAVVSGSRFAYCAARAPNRNSDILVVDLLQRAVVATWATTGEARPFAMAPGVALVTMSSGSTSALYGLDTGATTRRIQRGCHGEGERPVLRASDPVLGTVHAIAGSSAPPGSFGFLALSLGGPGAIPVHPWCQVQLAPASAIVHALVLTDPAGAWSASLPIPNAAPLTGMIVREAAFVAAPVLFATDTLEVMLGT